MAAKSLNIQALAIPVSCTSSVELTGYFNTVKRTKIGSPYVIAAFDDLMNNYSAVAEFEINGGFLLASNIYVNNKILLSLPTRDALLPVIAVLTLANSEPLSSLNTLLPQRFNYSDRIKNITKAKTAPPIQLGINMPAQLLSVFNMDELCIKDINITDGVRLTFSNQGVIHLRPFGNTPELRCYTENDSIAKAKALAESVLERVKNYVDLV
ncbi:hypothetical protein [Pseudoalteromonas distincta]|uniref:hypothetical protein n=1 Tax=Pseudoalteromonas distincta TaxID=77608 RepID=UPI00268BB4DA